MARAEAANSGLRAELAKATSGNPSGRLLAGVESGSGTASQSVGARIIPAALTSPVTLTAARPKPRQSEPQELSPLSLRLGTAYLTPVGFMDFTAVYHSTNVGSEIGTSFGGIPFNNTPAGKLSETRLSARNSRIGLRVDAKVKGALVLGYLESDFLGTNPGKVAVSSNGNRLRMRLYWADVRKDRWKLLAGQSRSLLTPNRRGLSPLPSDLFYTQDVDVNYQNGLVWGRLPQFRVVYHPNESAAFGGSLKNPEQYISGSPASHHRSIQETTFGFTHTFWRDANFGALQLMTQYSYLTRRPWFVAAGQPGEVYSNMVFINLRYVLPGSAPQLK